MDKIIFAYLNINSIRNKFDQVSDMIKGYIDVLMLSESKLDNSFLDRQFLIKGYGAPFPLDRNKLGEGITLFVRSDITAKLLSVDLGFKSFFAKLNCFYNPKSSNIESQLNCLSKSIDAHSSKYENKILLDFNSCTLNSSMKAFCEAYKFRSLVKEATCCKNPENPSCIDLILTN